VGRSARLRLPGLDGARLTWPDGKPTGAMLVLGDEPLGRELGLITLNAGVNDGAAALEWLADHAAELGADGPLLLAGAGAAELAARARENGWPEIAGVLDGSGELRPDQRRLRR
jgi:hypothetical protein